MSLAEQVVALSFSKDTFSKDIEDVMKKMIGFAALDAEEQEDLNTFKEEFVKEIENEYDSILQAYQKKIKEIYTPDQMQAILDINYNNPWFISGYKKAADALTAILQPIVQAIGQKMIEKATAEFKDEDEEDFKEE